MSDHDNLTALAYAGVYIEDLARGVEAEFTIEGGIGHQSNAEALREIFFCQHHLVRNGWKRDKREEARAPYSHNIEVAAYRKQFKPGQPSRWITLILAVRFGVDATFKGHKELTW